MDPYKVKPFEKKETGLQDVFIFLMICVFQTVLFVCRLLCWEYYSVYTPWLMVPICFWINCPSYPSVCWLNSIIVKSP